MMAFSSSVLRTVNPGDDAHTPPFWPSIAALVTLPEPTRLVSTYAARWTWYSGCGCGCGERIGAKEYGFVGDAQIRLLGDYVIKWSGRAAPPCEVPTCTLTVVFLHVPATPMSSEALPQGIYLFVKYNGTKAAQYFTKDFTHASASLFRQDLIKMRFPHPRVVNTRLAPDATAVAWWPDVSRKTHDVLFNNFKSSTKAASQNGILDVLSISFLIVREMEVGGKNPTLLACAKQDNVQVSTVQVLPPPAKRPRLEDASHLAPRSHSMTVRPSTAQKRTWDGQIISSGLPAKSSPSASGVLVPQQAPLLSSPRPSVPTTRITTTITHNLPPKPSGVPPPARTTPLNAQDTSATHLATGKDAELEALRERVKGMEEMLRTQLKVKVRLDDTANKLEAEQEARKKLEEMLVLAREREADAKRRLEGAQGQLAAESWSVGETRRDVVYYRDMCDAAMLERDELARSYQRAQEELAHFRHSRDASQDELDRVGPKLEQAERRLKEEKDRRRRYQDRLASAERREAALEQRCDEATQQIASLTVARGRYVLDARAAKQRDEEARRLREELEYAQLRILEQAEGAMNAARASEFEMSFRLEEVESSLKEMESRLETEERLRREAEDAIADIRRECREPFVVPSLLDAFVELAKLTTAATTPGHPGKREGKQKRDDAPPVTDEATDTMSCDVGALAAGTNTNETHNQPQRTSRRNPYNSSNCQMRSLRTTNQIKLERFSP
ncbi:hypothetical protein D9619_010320 [Psilocybe cf. subviscida]|uniref:Uncharacterized protein n=1 Tax=Psilocybe cf. subviscida TaxID=2480587 RepID=A0A8H5ARR2_9AGAR|nr:hypothetical protein D9619_010320 [Psilocybe cf. subviscida]